MGMKIMAPAFGLGPLDNTNGALKERAVQHIFRSLIPGSEIQPKTRNAGAVEKFFIALGKAGTHSSLLRRRVPIIGRGHRPAVGAEPDKERFVAEFFPHELTDV